MRLDRARLAAFIVIAVLFCGCSRKGELAPGVTRAREFYTHESAPRVHVCAVNEDAALLGLWFQIANEVGEVSWELLAPDGTCVWHGKAEGMQDIQKAAKFPQPAPGDWQLILEFQGATGDYELRWEPN